MDDRLHRALDGELAPDELPAELASELHDTRALLDGVVRAIPDRPLPPLGASVLQRIAAEERQAGPSLHLTGARPRRRPGVAAWLLAPQRMSVSVRPAWVLAAAAVLAVAVGIGGGLPGGPDETRATAGDVAASTPVVAGAAEVLVRFQLEAPQARTVTLAGDFSNWTPAHAMQRSNDGTWTIVVPLEPGVHEYAFVVDGARWIADPAAPAKPDGFGGMNSRVAVLRPDARS